MHVPDDFDAFSELVSLAVAKDPSLADKQTSQSRRKAAASVAGTCLSDFTFF